ncbi:hypothetical protein G6M14_25710 [Agrobacterium tumefaciens]|uniref:hypothetical protein n=1 Tax=Agrobacterium tumefaciens complex TaxID=1183400 RepID=UPI0015723736|nr:hypothetical protein [Agrobacterium fabrum]NSZ09771.1 hypothetical protein [Agrobacterium tumefaciens]
MKEADDSDVALQFDVFSIHARCCIALVGAIALLQKWVAKLDGREADPVTWKTFLIAARKAPTFQSAGKRISLDTCFIINETKRDKRRSLDRRNWDTVDRVANMIVDLIDAAYENGSLSLEKSDTGEGQEVGQKIGLLLKLCELQRESQPQGKPTKDDDKSHISGLIEEVDERPEDEAVVEFIESIFGKSTLDHPDFPAIKAFDIEALKAELLDLVDNNGEGGIHGGLFAIVREARSWSEKKDHLGNLIVRDILWLLPQEVDDEKPERNAGIYVSATDRAAFIVDRIVPEETMLHLVGHLEKNDRVAQRLKLILTKFGAGHGLEHRFGVLTGVKPSKSGQDLGSWKILAIRPTWDMRVLNCLIAQLYRTKIATCTKLLMDNNMCGVLYSNLINKNEPDLRQRRVSLRTLLMDEPSSQANLSTSLGGFLRSRFEERLNPYLKKFHSMPLPSDGQVEEFYKGHTNFLLDQIGVTLLENWIYVNPAQFFIFKKYAETSEVGDVAPEIIELLTPLLETTRVYKSVDLERSKELSA